MPLVLPLTSCAPESYYPLTLLQLSSPQHDCYCAPPGLEAPFADLLRDMTKWAADASSRSAAGGPPRAAAGGGGARQQGGGRTTEQPTTVRGDRRSE